MRSIDFLPIEILDATTRHQPNPGLPIILSRTQRDTKISDEPLVFTEARCFIGLTKER
jgi:hypothetical protein